MSPLGLTLELDNLCPSGILRAFTMPLPFKAELNTLQIPRLLQHARWLLPYCSVHLLLENCMQCVCILKGKAMPSSGL